MFTLVKSVVYCMRNERGKKLTVELLSSVFPVVLFICARK
uniref:Uncharacterized protein n=1 Tax=Rhizophora mucronata TaxID=61149 RepID=A0A2P2PHI0_RHIMU